MTPFKTNQQLVVEKSDREQKKREFENFTNNVNMKKQEQQNLYNEPLVDLKINQPLQQQMQPQMPQIYPSPYVPIPNPYYPYAPNGMFPWQYTPNNVPIIKKYNISLGNANGDPTRIANLFEDILPFGENVNISGFAPTSTLLI